MKKLSVQENNSRVNILIVDDKPEKVMALSVVLEDLQQNIVRAYSGKEALRCLLQQDFAVILLDVDMPGMDGFETASMIRKRKRSDSTPIIFVTAFGDDTHAARGYSLGAVDYILAPVVPEVLRTKVGVFVDLNRRTLQVERQADWLRKRTAQLHKVTEAALAVNSALSLEATLKVAAERACDVIGARQACAVTFRAPETADGLVIFSHSDPLVESIHDDGAWEPDDSVYSPPVTEQHPWPIDTFLCQLNKAVRMTQAELESHPAWKEWTGQSADHGMLRGLLAAPLSSREGKNMGLIRLSEKHDGDFTEEDEAVLVQLSQMVSIAIENTRFVEAREANRLKDEFLATLSHELRTPLNAIMGWTRLLQMQSLGPADVTRGLDIIDRNARAQIKLIEDLLDLSRITNGKMGLNIRHVSLGSVIQAALDASRPAAEAKEILVHQGPMPMPDQISADPDRLLQVIGNLLSNAIKFTPDRGHISIGVDRTPSHFLIRVSDTGKGISREFLPQVFDRFRQAESSTTRMQGGLGIGLAIVRHIVQLHGGTVHAESEGDGLGSVFTVRFPIHSRANGGLSVDYPLVQNDSQKALELSGVHVLVVEDERDAREMLVVILRRYKAHVTGVASVKEALEAFENARPHVVVSDISLPGEDGYSLIRRIRRRHPDGGGRVPALALTAHARKEDCARALSAGFQVHMAKPIEPEQLVLKLMQLVADGDKPSAIDLGRSIAD